jgi:hypothetical protein
LYHRICSRGRRTSLFAEYAADDVEVALSWLYLSRCKGLPRAKAGIS